MQDQEGLYQVESVWALKPKSLKEVLDEAMPPVWRDEKTGKPMHSHGVDCVNAKGNQDFYMPDPSPCDCGRAAFDIPLSAVHPQPTKGDR